MDFILGFFVGGISMAIFLDYQFCVELLEEAWEKTKRGMKRVYDHAGKMRNPFEK